MRNLARELTIGALLLEIASGCAAPPLSTPPAERPHGDCPQDKSALVIGNGENLWTACQRVTGSQNTETQEVKNCVSSLEGAGGHPVPVEVWPGDKLCGEWTNP